MLDFWIRIIDFLRTIPERIGDDPIIVKRYRKKQGLVFVNQFNITIELCKYLHAFFPGLVFFLPVVKKLYSFFVGETARHPGSKNVVLNNNDAVNADSAEERSNRQQLFIKSDQRLPGPFDGGKKIDPLIIKLNKIN